MFAELLILTQLPRLPRGPAAGLPPLPLSISMALKTAAGERRASAAPKQAQPEPRPLVTSRPGEAPQIRWFIRNTDAKKTLADLVVHLRVDREAAPGERIGPGPQKGAVIDTVLGTDLPPRGTTSGNYNTPIYEPGVYVVAVEILDARGNRRQLCVMDLKVE